MELIAAMAITAATGQILMTVFKLFRLVLNVLRLFFS